MKKDMFDNKYDYYFYKIENDKINEVLLNGIEIFSNQLTSDLKKVSISLNENNLLEKLRLIGNMNDDNKILIIKIPSYYMGWRHRNGVKESFVPLLKCFYDKEIFGVRTFLIPELIYGIYDSGKFTYNEQYNMFFDPSGLQYTDEQIGEMYGLRCYNLQKQAFDRKMYNYDELKKYDTQGQIWVNTMKYYKASKIK